MDSCTLATACSSARKWIFCRAPTRRGRGDSSVLLPGHGHAEHEPRPGGPPGASARAAAVPGGDLPGDRPAPARRRPPAERASSSRVNRSKTVSCVGAGSRARRRRRRARRCPRPPAGHGDRARARAGRRCRAGWRPPARAAPRRPRTWTGATSRTSMRGPRSRRAAASRSDHVVEVHRRRPRRRPAHRRRRARAAAGRRPAAAGPTVSPSTEAWVAAGSADAGMGGVDLELGPDAGQRAAQLVGGVGDEPPLPLGRPGQPVEHRVHRVRQPGDLVRGRRLRAPAGPAGWPRCGRPRRGSPRPAAAPGPTSHQTSPARTAVVSGTATSSERSSARVLLLDVLERAGDVTVSSPTGMASTRASVPSFGMLPSVDRRPPGGVGPDAAGRQAAARRRPPSRRGRPPGRRRRRRAGRLRDRPPGAQPVGDGVGLVGEALVEAVGEDGAMGERQAGARGAAAPRARPGRPVR